MLFEWAYITFIYFHFWTEATNTIVKISILVSLLLDLGLQIPRTERPILHLKIVMFFWYLDENLSAISEADQKMWGFVPLFMRKRMCSVNFM